MCIDVLESKMKYYLQKPDWFTSHVSQQVGSGNVYCVPRSIFLLIFIGSDHLGKKLYFS